MNTLTQYFVPEWVSILFLVAIPLPFILITLFVKQETQRFQASSAWKIVLSFFVLYLAYIGFASYQRLVQSGFAAAKSAIIYDFSLRFFAFYGRCKHVYL